MTPQNFNTAKESVRLALQLVLGSYEDVSREGLKDTPDRFVRALVEMTNGYLINPKDVVKTFEDGTCDEMVVVTDVSYASLCEHHLFPFFGKVHVGYLPGERIVGLSKVPRLVDVFAKRLQVQERMTMQIGNALVEHLKPRGVGVLVEGTHCCLSCRGAARPNAVMKTTFLGGLFKTDPSTRSEFYRLIGKGG